MDTFTHMLVAYFFNLTFSNPDEYAILFSVIMGIVPDIDLLWSPLVGHKHPYARHHGFTHSFIFVSLATFLGTLITYYLLGVHTTPLYLLFLWGLVGGLSHLLGDFLTTWSCPLLYPFSKRDYRYSLDTAVNPYLTILSLILIPLLFSMRTYRVDYSLYRILAYSVFAFYIGYFTLRAIIKIHVSRRFRRTDTHDYTAIPTSNPFVWYVVTRNYYDFSKRRWVGEPKIRYMQYNVLKGKGEPWQEFALVEGKVILPPIDSIEKAIHFAFHTTEVQDTIRKLKYPMVKVITGRQGKGRKYPYSIFCYALEMEGRNHIWGVLVDIDKDGNYVVRKSMYRKRDLK